MHPRENLYMLRTDAVKRKNRRKSPWTQRGARNHGEAEGIIGLPIVWQRGKSRSRQMFARSDDCQRGRLMEPGDFRARSVVATLLDNFRLSLITLLCIPLMWPAHAAAQRTIALCRPEV